MPRIANAINRRFFYYSEQAISSKAYAEKNYKLDLFITHGISKKEKERFLQSKEPYVKDAWLRMESS